MTPVTVAVVLVTLYVYAMAAISSRHVPTADDRTGGLLFVLIVPTLDEERVVAGTLRSLLVLRGDLRVLVVDDASADRTVAEVGPFLADPRVRLLERPPEGARRGKGAVLNAAYAEVEGMEEVERFGAENVITVVFDADTRVEPRFLEAVAPYFRDRRVAGVQSAVRMYNASRNLLTLWQHLEFAVWGRALLRAKDLLGSATLGGNGQCVRLAALRGLGGTPWRPASLTEDLDLSIRLLLDGWRLRFCPTVAVRQEAVATPGALVRQRARWLQGHVVCWRYVPALLASRLPLRARLDLVVFLLLPAVILPVGLLSVLSWARFLIHPYWSPAGMVSWYVIGFAVVPLVVMSWRRTDGPARWRLLVHGHLFVLYFFVWFAASVAVYWYVLRGRRAWTKTGHRADPLPVRAVRP